MDERLKRQLDFALEIDKEKNIFRQTHFSQNQSRHSLLPGFVLLIKCNYTARGISSLTL